MTTVAAAKAARLLAMAVVLLTTRGAAARTTAARGDAARPAAGGGRASRPTSLDGRVVATTAKRLYLDLGRFEGLAVGTELQIERGGRTVVACVVDGVGDHAATCKGKGAGGRVGDRVRLASRAGAGQAGPGAPGAGPAKPVVLPALARDDDVAAAAAALGATRQTLVVWKRPPGAEPSSARSAVAEVALRHDAWVTFAGDGRNGQLDRVDLAVRGAELPWGGLRGSLDLSASHWLQRADDTRFRPEVDTEVRVWEAAIFSHDPAIRRLVFGVGRFRPFAAPGITILDGAEVGWMSQDGSREIDLWGGVSPDAVTLAPSPERWVSGLGGVVTHSGARDALLRLVRAEARADVRHDPIGGTGSDAEAVLQMWWGRHVSLGGQARVVVPWSAPERSAAESASLDLAARTDGGWRLGAAGRFYGPTVLGAESLGDPLQPSGNPSPSEPWRGVYHGDVDLGWDAASWLSLTAAGGVSRDVATGEQRIFAGPDLAFPGVVRSGGLGVGYREEIGWSAGRSAYLQLHASPAQGLRYLVRASFYEDVVDGAPWMNWHHEAGLYASIGLRLGRHVDVRAHALGRASLEELAREGGEGDEGGGAGAVAGVPIGLVGGVELVGRL